MRFTIWLLDVATSCWNEVHIISTDKIWYTVDGTKTPTVNRAAVTGTNEKQQPKNNGHPTILKRGHIQATDCDQWCLLLFGLRGKRKHIIIMSLLLLFKFIDYSI